MVACVDCSVLLCLQVVISRGDLMKQAEKLLDDLGWSKAVLEIQYEHEVYACMSSCGVVSYELLSAIRKQSLYYLEPAAHGI